VASTRAITAVLIVCKHATVVIVNPCNHRLTVRAVGTTWTSQKRWNSGSSWRRPPTTSSPISSRTIATAPKSPQPAVPAHAARTVALKPVARKYCPNNSRPA
jgi:hypothetical protein